MTKKTRISIYLVMHGYAAKPMRSAAPSGGDQTAFAIKLRHPVLGEEAVEKIIEGTLVAY